MQFCTCGRTLWAWIMSITTSWTRRALLKWLWGLICSQFLSLAKYNSFSPSLKGLTSQRDLVCPPPQHFGTKGYPTSVICRSIPVLLQNDTAIKLFVYFVIFVPYPSAHSSIHGILVLYSTQVPVSLRGVRGGNVSGSFRPCATLSPAPIC